jgi:hypothetical protein
MDSGIEHLTAAMDKAGSVSEVFVEEILAGFDFTPPADYLAFILNHDGAEGVVNKSYLQILPIQDLAKYNKMYEADKYAAGYFIFGSNLGGTAYAFDKKGDKIVGFELVDMISGEMQVLGTDFSSFLKTLSEL